MDFSALQILTACPQHRPTTDGWVGWQAAGSPQAEARRRFVTSKAGAREAEEREAAHRREAMESGYAVAYKRVEVLKELAEKLYAELLDPSRRWLTEVKVVGSGKNAKEVVVERFNAAEVEQFRGVLADLAKEAGGQKDVTVLMGDADSPLEVRHKHQVDLTRLSDEELEQLEHLMKRANAEPTREGRSA